MCTHGILDVIASVLWNCSIAFFFFYSYIKLSRVKLVSGEILLKFILRTVVLALFLVLSMYAISGIEKGTLYYTLEILRFAAAAVIFKYMARGLEAACERENIKKQMEERDMEAPEDWDATIKEFMETRKGGKGFGFAAIASLLTLSVWYISLLIVLIIGALLPVLPPDSSLPFSYMIAIVVSVFLNIALYKYFAVKGFDVFSEDAATRKALITQNAILLGIFSVIRFGMNVEGPYSTADAAFVAALFAVIIVSAVIILSGLKVYSFSKTARKEYAKFVHILKHRDKNSKEEWETAMEQLLAALTALSKMADKSIFMMLAESFFDQLKELGIDIDALGI